MQVIVIKNKADCKVFRLSPETEVEKLTLRDAQKRVGKHRPRMIYAGRCEVDRHIRFNVGGNVRVMKNGEKGCAPKYTAEGGTTIIIKPRGENADDVFDMLKFLGICSAEIRITEFANGFICKAEPLETLSKHKRS